MPIPSPHVQLLALFVRSRGRFPFSNSTFASLIGLRGNPAVFTWILEDLSDAYESDLDDHLFSSDIDDDDDDANGPLVSTPSEKQSLTREAKISQRTNAVNQARASLILTIDGKRLGNDEKRLFLDYLDAAAAQADKAIPSWSSKNHLPGGALYKKWFEAEIFPVINPIIEGLMRDAEIHPYTLMIERKLSAFPPGGNTVSLIAPQVATSLFGLSAITERGVIVADLVVFVREYVLYNWDRLRKKWGRAKARVVAKEKKMLRAMAACDNETVNDDSFTAMVKEVKAFDDERQAYEATFAMWPGGDASAEAAKKVLARMIELKGFETETLQGRVSAKIQKRASSGKSVKPTSKVVAQIADDADAEALAALFQKAFEQAPDEGEAIADDQAPLDDVAQDIRDLLDSEDLGVQHQAKLTSQQMTKDLGFLDGRPVLFQTTRRLDGATGWEPSLASASPTAAVPLFPLYHQVAGMHAILLHMFRSQDEIDDLSQLGKKGNDDLRAGVLLADGVGVGKTAQIMGALATIMHWHDAQERQSTPVPFLARRPYYMGEASIPDLPHLIVVPPSLTSQWANELERFFRPHMIDIYQFPSDRSVQETFFTRADSPWMQSSQKMVNRIVVASNSTLVPLYSRFFLPDSECPDTERQALLIDTPRRPRAGLDLKQSLFRDWSTVWFDEAHDLRNPGKLFRAAFELQQRSKAVVLSTATPFVTQPRDLTMLGRLMRLPAFSGLEAEKQDRTQKRVLDRARNQVNANDATLARFVSTSSISRGPDDDDMDVDEEEDAPDAQVKYRDVQASIILSIRDKYGDRIIRRTQKSKTPSGAPINQELPELVLHELIVKLPEDEQEFIEKKGTQVSNKVGHTSLEKIVTSNFYIGYRLAIAYPANEPFPTIRTLDDWRNHKGTKLDTLISLVRHLLSDDDAEHPSMNVDGSINWPGPKAYPSGLAPKKTRKIIVNHSFRMLSDTMQQAFNAHGINVVIINGNTKPAQRGKVVNSFIQENTDPQSPRVMLFTSVLMTGVNLTCADVVITFDVLWSAVMMDQVYGRAWRIGQKKPVHAYSILAAKTTDVLISRLSDSKGDMCRAFLSKDVNRSLVNLMHGREKHSEGLSAAEEKAMSDPAVESITKPRKVSRRKAVLSQASGSAAASTSKKSTTSTASSRPAASTTSIRSPSRDSSHKRLKRAHSSPSKAARSSSPSKRRLKHQADPTNLVLDHEEPASSKQKQVRPRTNSYDRGQSRRPTKRSRTGLHQPPIEEPMDVDASDLGHVEELALDTSRSTYLQDMAHHTSSLEAFKAYLIGDRESREAMLKTDPTSRSGDSSVSENGGVGEDDDEATGPSASSTDQNAVSELVDEEQELTESEWGGFAHSDIGSDDGGQTNLDREDSTDSEDRGDPEALVLSQCEEADEEEESDDDSDEDDKPKDEADSDGSDDSADGTNSTGSTDSDDEERGRERTSFFGVKEDEDEESSEGEGPDQEEESSAEGSHVGIAGSQVQRDEVDDIEVGPGSGGDFVVTDIDDGMDDDATDVKSCRGHDGDATEDLISLYSDSTDGAVARRGQAHRRSKAPSGATQRVRSQGTSSAATTAVTAHTPPASASRRRLAPAAHKASFSAPSVEGRPHVVPPTPADASQAVPVTTSLFSPLSDASSPAPPSSSIDLLGPSPLSSTPNSVMAADPELDQMGPYAPASVGRRRPIDLPPHLFDPRRTITWKNIPSRYRIIWVDDKGAHYGWVIVYDLSAWTFTRMRYKEKYWSTSPTTLWRPMIWTRPTQRPTAIAPLPSSTPLETLDRADAVMIQTDEANRAGGTCPPSFLSTHPLPPWRKEPSLEFIADTVNYCVAQVSKGNGSALRPGSAKWYPLPRGFTIPPAGTPLNIYFWDSKIRPRNAGLAISTASSAKMYSAVASGSQLPHQGRPDSSSTRDSSNRPGYRTLTEHAHAGYSHDADDKNLPQTPKFGMIRGVGGAVPPKASKRRLPS